MLTKQASPDLNVFVFDFGETAVKVFLRSVWLGVRKKTVEIRGVRLVLPMMREGVEVGVGRLTGRRVGGGYHKQKYDGLTRRRPANQKPGNPRVATACRIPTIQHHSVRTHATSY